MGPREDPGSEISANKMTVNENGDKSRPADAEKLCEQPPLIKRSLATMELDLVTEKEACDMVGVGV